MPLMVTGGFRTRAGMETALLPLPLAGEVDRRSGEGSALPLAGEAGDCDVIGLGRPLCWQPDLPRRLLAREVDGVERLEDRQRFADRGWRSPSSPLLAARALNALGAQSWYYCQIFRLADGRPPDLERGLLSSLLEYLRDELATARRLRKTGKTGDTHRITS